MRLNAVPVLLAFALLAGAPALAEPDVRVAASEDRAAQLRSIESEIAQSDSEKARLSAEIEALRDDGAALETALIEATARVRAAEDAIAAAADSFETAQRQEAALAASLSARRDVIANVLAALQRLRRGAPPAVFVAPDDMLSAVRAAILMGAIVPELRAEAITLAEDLRALAAARAEMQEAQTAAQRQRDAMRADAARVSALVDERRRAVEASRGRLDATLARRASLAAQARTLNDLIERLEADDAAARLLEEASQAVPAAPRGAPPGGGADVAIAPAAGRLRPRQPFASLRGRLALPVAGSILASAGREAGLAVDRGVTISTLRGATVSASADAHVAFAAPYRSFGMVLILALGEDYHLVLIGLEEATVRPGQFVLAGEPLGVMQRAADGTDAAGEKRDPALYVELRKNGAPIDPRSWWAAADKVKAGG